MSEKNDITTAREKFVTGSEQARKALEATAEAAKSVGGVVKKEARDAFVSGKEYLGKAAKSFSEAATEGYDAIREQAHEKAGQYREKAEHALQDVSCKAKNVQSDVEDYIRTHPLKSICLALGLGFVLASLFKR